MNGLTGVSLFAGIGGIDLALERAGVTVRAAVEIDPACRGVLACHFPETKLFNDVTEVTGDQLRAAGFVPERGILAGGFPCQDLSVAGRRAGLGGTRSGLFWHIMRLADELRPQWLLLENVPGLLFAVCSCPGDGTCTGNGRAVRCGTTGKRGGRIVFVPGARHNPDGGTCPGGCMAAHGGAMGAVLGALGKRGYGFAYRVLDARFFGVPQRRERVFIVGRLGDRAAPVQVLLEPEGGQRHPAPRRAPRKGSASRTGGGTVSTLQGGGRRGYRIDAEGAAGGHLIAVPIQDGRGFEKAQNGMGVGSAGDPSFTLDTTGAQSVMAFAENQRGEVVETTYSHQLTTGGGKSGQGYAAVRTASAVRRLTPKERERLQGFPDDWTRWRIENSRLTEQSDAARDRQTGNAVAVPCVEWIARRIVAADSSTASPVAANDAERPSAEAEAPASAVSAELPGQQLLFELGAA